MKQQWGSRLGVILAVAGSAVGLGNFLRFPVQAAQNGGGAFMIPYFIALVFLGLPLMWIEWTLGRFGGGFEHSTAPGIFHSLWAKNRFIKYFGVIGIFGPLVIFIYYTYIESWLLAYSYFALSGKYVAAVATQATLKSFLMGFQGLEVNQFFPNLGSAYFFFLLTFLLNIGVLYFGIKGGIERLCRLALPALFIFGFILLLRIATLGAPNAAHPEWTIGRGFGYLWNPDFSALLNARTWLAAAGQVFFTLSVGLGVILTYASYLNKKDDVVLSGLTAVSTNQVAEVILGGSLVIPLAFAFFGPADISLVAKSGAFNLGFVTMPLIFQKIPLGALFAFLWFVLLFLAGICSSVSLAQPAIAFLEDEFAWTRKKSVWIFGLVSFLLCQPAIFGLAHGVVDELDFWGGTFCLVIFGTVEAVLFGWVFGIDKAWDEIHTGAAWCLPHYYKWIIKYITPIFLLAILSFWLFQEGIPAFLMKNVPPANRPVVLTVRLGLFLLFCALSWSVHWAWSRRAARESNQRS